MSKDARVRPIRRHTQVDVARLAGVAQCTVSQVLNETDERRASVSPATRRRILEAARVLAYRPVAGGLLQRRRDVLIGLIGAGVGPRAASEVDLVVRRGIEREVTLLGCDLVIYSSGAGPRPVRRAIGLDGCIVIASATDVQEWDRTCPVVRIRPDELASSREQTNLAYAVGRSAVRQLISTI